MGDEESIVEELQALLENLGRTLEGRLSKVETSREETDRLQEGYVGGGMPLHREGAGTGERAGSASPSRRD